MLKDQANGPILIHAITQKGKGYEPAEASSDKYHGVAKFNVVSGQQQKTPSNAPSYTKVFAKRLLLKRVKMTKLLQLLQQCQTELG